MIIYDEDDEPGPGHGWALAGAAAVAVAASVAIVFTQSSIFEPMVVAGRFVIGLIVTMAFSFLLALLIFAVFHFVWLRDRAPNRGFESFLVVFGATIATNIVILAVASAMLYRAPTPGMAYTPPSVFSYQTQTQTQTALGQDALVDVLASSRIAVLNTLSSHGGVTVVNTRAPGEAGVIARAQKALIDEGSSLSRNYNAQLDALGVPDVARPANFEADLPGVRSKLKRGRAVIKTYRTRLYAALATYRSVLANAQIDPAWKAKALADYDEAVATNKPGSDQRFDAIDALFAELQAMTADLAHPHSPWKVVGGNMVFYTDADIKTYEAHGRRANALAAKLRAIATASGDR